MPGAIDEFLAAVVTLLPDPVEVTLGVDGEVPAWEALVFLDPFDSAIPATAAEMTITAPARAITIFNLPRLSREPFPSWRIHEFEGSWEVMTKSHPIEDVALSHVVPVCERQRGRG